METTRILWSGLTGRTGREAVVAARSMPDVEIVAGMKRNVTGADDCHLRGGLYDNVNWLDYKTGVCGLCGLGRLIERTADIIVDFSSPEVFDEVLKVAIRADKPLISGTSGLSNQQIASLYDATNRIPVFRGGNFRFKVKKFIDEAVKLAMTTPGNLTLYENFYKGKSLPSETSKVLQDRILKATGRRIEVHSSATFAQGNWISDWELQIHQRFSPTVVSQDKLHCRVIGFDELAHDVLEIAKVMAKKPVRPGKFYDLDEIWDDLML